MQTPKDSKSCLVILSGGQDSTTALFMARRHFRSVRALTFDYGQRHRIEIDSATTIAKMAEVSHEVIDIKDVLLSTSPLLSDRPLEQYQDHNTMEKIIGNRTELTFVPMRNALFATIAANRAVLHGCEVVYLGICEEDNANYPDCTEDFLNALNKYVYNALGRDYRVEFEAPLIFSTKVETVRQALRMPGCFEALAYSHTSYDGKYPPTDKNHANILRAHGFEEAGWPDPLVLRAWSESLMALPTTENYDPWHGVNEKKEAFAAWLRNFS